jgi:opacity protein-like surface antigen
MMKQVFRLTVCVLGLTLLSSQAFAQALQWEARGYVNLNYGMQTGSTSLATTSETRTIYDEPGKFTTAQTIDAQAPFIDFGGGVRVIGNFGLGFSYSRLSTEGSAVITAQVPSPLVYDQPRKASSTLTGIEHVEEGFHFQAIWMLPITDKFDVVFSGGPTLFKLSQGVVATPVAWSEVGPPYTTVNVAVSKVTVSDSQVGFNVGADLTYRFANNVGVGAMVRYAAATVGLTPEGGSALDVKVGGFQVGGGLRLRF